MILVTGATGNVGRKLVELLAAAGEKVRAVSRDPNKANLPAGVEVVAADLLKPETLGPAFAGVERVFALLHLPGSAEQAINFSAAAAASGVKRIVMFSSGTVEREITGDSVGESHRAAEAELRKANKPITFLRPGTLMFNSLSWAPQIKAGDLVRGIDIAPAALMHEADVARAAFALLTAEGAMAPSYQITGPEALSAADQLQILGGVLGKKLVFEPLSKDQAAGLIAQHSHGHGDPYALMDNVMSENVVWGKPNNVFEKLTGEKPCSYETWAREHAAAFR